MSNAASSHLMLVKQTIHRDEVAWYCHVSRKGNICQQQVESNQDMVTYHWRSSKKNRIGVAVVDIAVMNRFR